MLKYQYILYSRSLTIDYRWMIIPENGTLADMKKLESIYDGYDLHKSKRALQNADVAPIYCLQLSNMIAFVRCSSSNFKDSVGRDIYCLQGMCIPLDYARHFWFALPWLLVQHNSILNVWKNINFQTADSLSKFKSTSHELDLNFDNHPPVNISDNLPQNTLPDDRVVLSFNNDGFKQLLRFISSPSTPLLDFAFGATPEMIKNFDSCKIIATVHNLTGLQAIGDGILSILSWGKR